MQIAQTGSRFAQQHLRATFSKPAQVVARTSESFSPPEIVMASPLIRHRISRFAFAAPSMVVCLSWAGPAFASQGPGGGPGTASSFTQLVMAIIVYGASLLVVGAGLIGAARRRSH